MRRENLRGLARELTARNEPIAAVRWRNGLWYQQGEECEGQCSAKRELKQANPPVPCRTTCGSSELGAIKKSLAKAHIFLRCSCSFRMEEPMAKRSRQPRTYYPSQR